MGRPVTTKNAAFQCFAFPDVCLTPAAPNPVPIPYPNIGQFSDTEQASGANGKDPVRIGGDPVVLKNSSIPRTSGDEAGTLGGVVQPFQMGKAEFTTASLTVRVNGQGVVRLGDSTTQNQGNCVGTVLGGVPTVRAGG